MQKNFGWKSVHVKPLQVRPKNLYKELIQKDIHVLEREKK